jgi:hypothetical protein
MEESELIEAMGLPDVGWEQVVWGGIGLESDDESR